MEIWLPVAIGGIVNLMIAAYFYGGVSNEVKTLTKSVEKIDSDNDNQWSDIKDHEGRISYLEAKSNGKHAH